MSPNRPGKLNNHLEAAIHEAMSELDKMSGTVSISTFLYLRERRRSRVVLTVTSPPRLCPSDPVQGPPGEAPQAEEEEDIQITLNVSSVQP